MGGGLLASVASTVGSGSNESFAIRRGRTRRAGTTGEVDRGRSATSYKVAARFFFENLHAKRRVELSFVRGDAVEMVEALRTFSFALFSLPYYFVGQQRLAIRD